MNDDEALRLTPGRRVIVTSLGRALAEHVVTVEKVEQFDDLVLVLVSPPDAMPKVVLYPDDLEAVH